jgi:hypothetical protein
MGLIIMYLRDRLLNELRGVGAGYRLSGIGYHEYC